MYELWLYISEILRRKVTVRIIMIIYKATIYTLTDHFPNEYIRHDRQLRETFDSWKIIYIPKNGSNYIYKKLWVGLETGVKTS
jgi:hypothetical protein